jgi:hypothetical protein
MGYLKTIVRYLLLISFRFSADLPPKIKSSWLRSSLTVIKGASRNDTTHIAQRYETSDSSRNTGVSLGAKSKNKVREARQEVMYGGD